MDQVTYNYEGPIGGFTMVTLVCRGLAVGCWLWVVGGWLLEIGSWGRTVVDFRGGGDFFSVL